MRKQRNVMVAALALVLGASACTSSDTTDQTVNLDPDEIVLTGGLRLVESCDALLSQFKVIGAEHVGPYGFGEGWYGPVVMEDSVAATDSSAAEAPGAPAAESGSAGAYSGTNNQETNVDEADLVKTDGLRLVVVTRNIVRVFDVSGDEPRETAAIKLPDDVYGGEIFLNGDTAYLMTTGWIDGAILSSLDSTRPAGTQTARLFELNLAEGTVGRTIDVDGQYVSARQVGDTIRIVLSSATQSFPFVYPSNPGAEDSAKEANQDLLARSTIDMWLPGYRITDDGAVVDEGTIVGCDRVYLPVEFSGFGTISVVTIDTNEGLTSGSIGKGNSIGVMSSGDMVYSSTDRMMIATARAPRFDGNGEPETEEDYTTSIHSFDITDPATTQYVSSGSVNGHLLNQYAMSEHDGYLRVATTEGALWWTDESSESSVIVLKEEGDQLKTVGEVAGLGKGEQIYAVRFMSDQAYVVTYRQTDPLYVVDLSDPANPRTTGELKIPGFSAYLHPLADGQLLGIGQDGTDEGQTTGAAVSLFDVSDPANPSRLDVINLGENSYSSVDWDAKAFTWWEPTTTGFVPISWWNYAEADGGESGSGAAAIVVNDDKLQDTGRISHPTVRECDIIDGGYPIPEPLETDDAEASFVESAATAPVPSDDCWEYQAEIRRTVIVNDKVYTISDAGMKVNALDGLAELGWVPFN